MNRRPHITLLALVGLAAAWLAPAAQAQSVQLIGNLPGNDGTSTFINGPLDGSNGGGAFDSKAAGFTLPIGLPYQLDAVDLRLAFFSLSSVPVVDIYNNAANNPGTSLLRLTNPALSVATGTFRFTPGAPFMLDAGTTYWIVVSNAASVANSFRWLASVPNVTPTGIATSAGYRFDFGPPPPSSNSATLNSYAVFGTVIPEPGTVALLAVLTPGAAFLLRRRKEA